MKKINNKGFTLIELLTTITILAVVLSITLFFGVNLIKNAREKSYEVTKNNVEKAAVAYLKENNDITFIEGTDELNEIEYQCIKVKNLIDYGYFDTEILKSEYKQDEKVTPDQFIYIERNITTKTIISSEFPSESTYCDSIANHDKSITITYDKGWAKSKKVKITYKLNSITNLNDIKEFKYLYDINGINQIDETFKNKTVSKSFNITENNSEIYAKIYNKDSSTHKIAEISKIDNLKPQIQELSGDTEYSKTKSIQVTISDITNDTSDASGFDSNDRTLTVQYGWSLSNETAPTNYKEATLQYNNCNETKPTTECKEATFNAIYDQKGSGNYYLWIKPTMADIAGNEVEEYISSGTYKVANENTFVPIITRIDYNTFTYEVEDKTKNVTYYLSTTELTPEENDEGWTNENTKDVTEETTYYVWSKDEAGNISLPSSISSYKISRTEGKGTTLKTKYDSDGEDSGTEFKEEIIALEGTPIWAKAAAKEGYNTPKIKYGETLSDSAESKIIVTESIEISSSAKTNVLIFNNQTIEIKYNDADQTKTIEGATNGSGEYIYTINENDNFSISSTTITIKGGTKPGTYEIDVTVKDTETSETETITLKIIIKDIVSTISYQDCGNKEFSGTHEENYPIKYTHGIETKLDNPTKTGYLFNGYYEESTCSGTEITSIGTEETENKIFYAKWTPIVYNITYILNGGTASNPTSYTIETDSFTINNPVKENSEFIGWTEENDDTPKTEIIIEKGSIGNKEYTAKWENVATFYYYNGSEVVSINTTCKGEMSCEVTIPEEVKNSKGKYNGIYKGLSKSTNLMDAAITTEKTNIEINSNISYYAIYQTPVTLYYPVSSLTTSNTLWYRNEYITSDKEIVSNLSSNVTGTSDETTINGIIGTFKGLALEPESTNTITIQEAKNREETTYYGLSITTIEVTIYYQSDKTLGNCMVASTKTTGQRINYCKTATQAWTKEGDITVPSEVTESIGKYNSTYKSLSSKPATMIRATPTTANTTYYAIYEEPIILNFLSDELKVSKTTKYRNEWLTGTSEDSCGVPVISNNSGTTNYIPNTSPNGAEFKGLATTNTTKIEYETVAEAAESDIKEIYEIYEFNISYKTGSNVSSISNENGTCKIATSSTSCTVTLPSITANTGYTSASWSSTSGATSGLAAGSSYTLTKNGEILYANAVANELTFNNQTLKAGTYNKSYTDSFTVASGGTGTYKYSVSEVKKDGIQVAISDNNYNGLSINGTTISGTPTTAGTYKFTIDVVDENSGAKASATITIVIEKEENPIIVTSKTYTFDNTEKELLAINNAQGNVCYSNEEIVTSCSSTETIPTGINAGTHTIYWYVTGNTNYSSKSGSITSTINKKSLEIPTLSGTLIYNTENQQPSFNNYDEKWMVIEGTNVASLVGNYDAVLHLKDTANTQWNDGTSTTKTVTWTIEPYNISNATIETVQQQEYEQGVSYTPKPTVTVPLPVDSSTTLVETVDFTYNYTNNSTLGTASITVTGKGNYTGTKETTFIIADTIKPVCVFDEWLSSEIQISEPTTINLTCTDEGSGIPETNLSSTAFDYAIPTWNGKIDFSSIVTKGNETERVYEISVTGKEAGRLMLKLIEGAIKDNAGNSNDEAATLGTIEVVAPLSCTISYEKSSNKILRVQSGRTNVRIRSTTDTSSTSNILASVDGGAQYPFISTAGTSDCSDGWKKILYNKTTEAYICGNYTEEIDYSEEESIDDYYRIIDLKINASETEGITYSFDGTNFSETNILPTMSSGTHTAYIKNAEGEIKNCTANVISRKEYYSRECNTTSYYYLQSYSCQGSSTITAQYTTKELCDNSCSTRQSSCGTSDFTCTCTSKCSCSSWGSYSWGTTAVTSKACVTDLNETRYTYKVE